MDTKPMMNLDHLDIYIYFKYTSKIDKLFTKKELLKKVNAEYSKGFTEEELMKCFEGLGKPKTYQVVHRLSELGFSNKTIGNWLEISQSTISIHLHKDENTIKEYKNYKLLEYFNHKLYLLRNFGEDTF